MKPALWIVIGSAAVLIATIAVIVLAVSCRDEDEKPSFARVHLALSDPDPQVGLAELEHYLERNPDSAQAHLLLATLYDERLNRPLDAIAEYRLYQKNAPTANRAEIERWITAARKRCYIEWSSEFADAEDSALRRELLKLQNENRELRWQLGEFERFIAEPLPGAPAAAPRPNDTPPPPSAPTTNDTPQTAVQNKSSSATGSGVYEVQSGDNLQKISKKLYGTSKFYKLLYECNRDTMKSPNSLHAGQKLKLPAPEALKSAGGGAKKQAAAPQVAAVGTKLPPIPPLTAEQLKNIRTDGADADASKKNDGAALSTDAGTPTVETGRSATPTPYLY